MNVLLRGKEYRLSSRCGLETALAFALHALDDPRIDAVFRAFGVEFCDVDGVLIWPVEDEPDQEKSGL